MKVEKADSNMIEIPELNFDGFAEWLDCHRSLDLVGECGNAMACPLANYLNDVRPGYKFEVANKYVFGSDSDLILDMPEWATRFVHRLDSVAEEAWVSADFARRILDDVKEFV